jgi:hypothetical protein
VQPFHKEQEITMAKAAKKTTAKKASKTNGKSKSSQVIAKMKSAKGCTREQALKILGWQAVSMQQLCEAAGVKIKLEKIEGQRAIIYRADSGQQKLHLESDR